MSNELERMWKETVMSWLGYYPRICLKWLRKITISFMLVDEPAEIQTVASRQQ